MQNPLKQIPQALRLQQAIAFLRIMVGSFYLYVGWQKVTHPQFTVGLASQLQNWSGQNPFFWYQDFLNFIAIPNAPYVAFVVGWGEVLVGASYLLGLLLPFSAPVAFGLNLNYFFAGQHSSPSVMAVNLAFMVIALTLFWSGAGQCFGLDHWVFRQPGAASGKPKKRIRGVSAVSAKKKQKTSPKRQPKAPKPVVAARVIENLIEDDDEDDD